VVDCKNWRRDLSSAAVVIAGNNPIVICNDVKKLFHVW
jgi:hypothetical protein